MAAFANSANVFLDHEMVTGIYGPNPSTTRGAGVHMTCHPRESNLIVYASGRLIVVKDLNDPSNSFVYRGHNAQTTCAKFAPSGMFVASGDSSGKVRVWSWTHKEKLLKVEVQVFSGPVRDLDWDFENKKITAAGEGSGILAKTIMWDTGNSTGEMTGHNKAVLSCAFKPKRPFRVATCSEDFKTCFFAGPPFKLDHSKSCHTNFVNCLRYTADGDKFVTCGTDKKVQFYDGATGEPQHSITNAHAGSIYSVSWSPDGSKVVTVSADKSMKIWNAADGAPIKTVQFGNSDVLGGMLVSVLWTPFGTIVALSLDGTLWTLAVDGDAVAEPKPIYGHQVAISASCVSGGDSPTLFTGSNDGTVIATPLGGGVPGGGSIKFPSEDKRSVSGSLHASKVSGLLLPFPDAPNQLITAGWDNCVKTSVTDGAGDEGTKTTALSGQPRGLAVSSSSSLIATATANEVTVMQGMGFDTVASVSGLTYQPTCLTITPTGGEVIVGGSDDSTHVYTVGDAGALTETHKLATRSAVSALAISPDGNYLAVGDNGRQIEVFKKSDEGAWESHIKSKWVFHTSKVTALAFSPSGDRVVSGSLDESLFLWRVSNPAARLQIKFAHNTGVNTAAWTSEEELVTTGSDACIVTWKVPNDAA